MLTVSLLILPGEGRRVCRNVPRTTTLAAFAEAQGITNRMLMFNGETIPASNWGSVTFDQVDGRVEIAAVAGSKGN